MLSEVQHHANSCAVVKGSPPGQLLLGDTLDLTPAVCPDAGNAVEDTRELPEVSQDEYGEEDHGPATAGGV
ncbi:hypothetical protein AV530_012056 [Patagioenas fasciata monilis]|uniref:Uncharacterized protein n=1 Tax=Patagioenas fasciata monilis TaxID=372326 RepID=A0A1V4JUW7_PATFA|nr:hypothetical protein AV530_012056 [Patagioenas fasciata monilis]